MTSDDELNPEIPLEPPEPGLLHQILAVCFWPLGFAGDWLYGRPWMALLLGLPALVVCGAAAAAVLNGRYAPREHLWKLYYQRATLALSRRHSAAAELYARRMVLLDETAPQGFYSLALATALRGDRDRARSLMARVAPERGTGYAPAHLWLARDMLRAGTSLTPDAARVLEHHLQQAHAGHADDLETHALLGQLYGARGDAKRAIPHLEAAALRRPELKLMLALMYERQQDRAALRLQARAARDFFRERAQANSTAVEERVQWALSEALLDEHAEAVRILRAGLSSSAPQRFQTALVEIYIRWYAAVLKTDANNLAKQLDLLNSALMFSPDDPRVLTALADLATRDWEGADEAWETVQTALVRGVAPTAVHVLLGTRALQRGDEQSGRLHLELAYKHNPQMPAVLNNLAWDLIRREKPELERALQLAVAAKGLSPHPEIADTIGTILARLGRQREAIKELETAVRAFPDRPQLHEKLADLYEQLGDAELAARHRQQASAGRKKP